MRLTRILFATPLILILPATWALADSWRLPTEEIVDSPNGRYRVTIQPRGLESQLKYFKEKSEGQSGKTAGAPEEGGREKYRGPMATLIESSSGSKPIAHFPLLNEVAPVSALVSDSGRFLVTFDNWHSIGYGEHVVAIYRSDGEVVRSFKLEELLTEGDLGVLRRSVSSRYWSGEHRIDEAKNELVLEITRCQNPSKCASDPVPLRIDLATGEPLQPKTDLLPQPRPEISVASIEEEEFDRKPGKFQCQGGASLEDHGDARPVPLGTATAQSLAPPEFSELAFKAGVHGQVVLELLVLPDGHVACALVLRSLPLGLDEQSLEAALGWRFEASSQAVRLLAAIEFKIIYDQGGLGMSVFRAREN